MADRQSWIDEKSNEVLIDDHARKLESFTEAFADGVIDDSEVRAQEDRVIALMKEVEPLLDDEAHEKCTRLLCELTAFNIMQFFHEMMESRPKTQFRG